MASLLIRLSTERERKGSGDPPVGITTRIVLISTLILTAASGCGMATIASYLDYRECLRKCEEKKYEDDWSKQQCESACVSRFDWSDSPLGTDKPKPKSEFDKMTEPLRSRKQ